MENKQKKKKKEMLVGFFIRVLALNLRWKPNFKQAAEFRSIESCQHRFG